MGGVAMGPLFMVVMGVWTVVVTVFWMVVAWRAMRAHERLASAAERMTARDRISS